MAPDWNFVAQTTQVIRMKQITYFVILCVATLLGACKEDLGPYKEVTRAYPLDNFSQLTMESGLRVDVQAGNTFSVAVRGNEEDVNDLVLTVRQGVLYAQYKNSRRRNRYDTFVTITMPTIQAVNFSGAVKATITGFLHLNELSVELSGASKTDYKGNVNLVKSILSGASTLTMTGEGKKLVSELSGASQLEAYDYPADEADLDVSGASEARIRINDMLKVKASGASKVRYRGNPQKYIDVSGASMVVQE